MPETWICAPLDEDRRREPGEDRVGDLFRRLGARAVEQDGEFVAADARAAGARRAPP